MRSWKTTALVILALVVAGNWIATRIDSVPPAPSPVPEIKAAKPPGPSVAQSVPAPEIAPPDAHAEPVKPQPKSGEFRAASRRDLENPLVSSYPPSTPQTRRAIDAEQETAADFDKIALMFRDYRTLTGENPVGTNEEIMKAIMGENPKDAKLGPPEGQNINSNGELIDRWGTPYFFHQLTKDRMEIRSAGPDRILWNEDDLTGD